jgi:hypothetical protein
MQIAAQNPKRRAQNAWPIYAAIRPKHFACGRSRTTHLHVSGFTRNWSNHTCVQPIQKLSGASPGLIQTCIGRLRVRCMRLGLMRALVVCELLPAQNDAIGCPILSGQIALGIFVAARPEALDADFEVRFSDLSRFSSLGFRSSW